MEHNLKNFNNIQKTDATSFAWRELFVQKKIADENRTLFLTKLYLRENDSVRNAGLEKVNHILGQW